MTPRVTHTGTIGAAGAFFFFVFLYAGPLLIKKTSIITTSHYIVFGRVFKLWTRNYYHIIIIYFVRYQGRYKNVIDRYGPTWYGVYVLIACIRQSSANISQVGINRRPPGSSTASVCTHFVTFNIQRLF